LKPILFRHLKTPKTTLLNLLKSRSSKMSTTTTTPGLIVTILWPRTADLSFDLHYYTQTHVPLAQKLWASRGCIASYVSEPGPESEYAYTSTLLWESAEAFAAAREVEEEMKQIMEDVPNFTNGTPVFVAGKVVN
jgi:uncharacterized protein (TIGR02118 family)